jgi:hypothetical protein
MGAKLASSVGLVVASVLFAFSFGMPSGPLPMVFPVAVFAWGAVVVALSL